jgi:hypothetical protein
MFIRKPDNSNGSADKMYSDLVVFSRIMSFECITVNNRLIFFFFFYISEGFSGVRVAQSLAFSVVLIIVYHFVYFSFGHCIVCPSSIHGF